MVRFTGAEPVVFAIAIGCDALLAFAHLARCACAVLRREACDITRIGWFFLSGHPKTGQRWSGQNRPTGRGRGLSCFILPPPVVASLFSYANSEDHI
jgi:hypothetical protein